MEAKGFGGLHDERQGLTVGAEEVAVCVPFGHAGVCQVLVGKILVELCIERIPLFVVELCHVLRNGALHRFALADVKYIDDLLAVEAVGHGDTEVLVVKDFAHALIFVVQVEVEPGGIADAARLEELVFTWFAIVGDNGFVVIGVEVAAHHVDFAVEHFQQEDFAVFENVIDDAVDVGQLIAFGIDFPEVGVALQDQLGAFAVGYRHFPGHERGKVGIEPARVGRCARHAGALHLVKVDPVVGVVLSDQLIQIFGVVVHVELGAVVLGNTGEDAAAGGGQVLQEEAVGGVESDFQCVVVDGLKGGVGFAGAHPAGCPPRAQLFIEDLVIPPEGKVVGCEGLAVGPLHTFSESEGVFAGVGTGADTFGRVGDNAFPLR